MKWFGTPWDAPICRISEHADTPVGALCVDCKLPIHESDSGFIVPYMSYPVHSYTEAIYHRGCFVRYFSLDLQPVAEHFVKGGPETSSRKP